MMRHRLARCLFIANPTFTPVRLQARFSSTNAASDKPVTASLNPRWLSELKTRIGKCIMFGLTTAQTKEASIVLEEMTRDWRELVAGSEGFLTEENRRGLYRQAVVWGEMVFSPPWKVD
jgi:hypothetical protein